MDALLLVVRLVLAGVFIVAAITKLTDQGGTRRAVRDFGAPAALAAPAALLLPLAELVIAGMLISRTAALWGAVAAIVLLGLFVAAIGVNMARGRRPDCHCFGQLHSEPIGWPTIGRNGVLAALAALVVVEPGPSLTGWLGERSTGELLVLVGVIVVAAVVAAQWWVVLHLLQQNGRLLLRLEKLEGILTPEGMEDDVAPASQEGLAVGTPAPAFTVQSLDGETVTLDTLLASGKPLLAIFTDPGCGPCNALLPDIGVWQRQHGDRMTIALLSRGDVSENRTKADEHDLQHVLLQQDREVMSTYQVIGTPSAVLIGADGRIASPVAPGGEAIRRLVRRSADGRPMIPLRPAAPARPATGNGNGSYAGPAALPIGSPAPSLAFRDLAGNQVRLDGPRERDALVLFWNPSCGFCQRMADDLRAWAADAPATAPDLIVVSRGTAEENRNLPESATVLLDEGFSAGRSLGASGTPSALLIDREGRIASQLAVGAPSVLELATGGAMVRN